MTPEKKLEIDRLVCAYMDSLDIDALIEEIGWYGSGVMGRTIDYAGQIPHGTGMDQSNYGMVLMIDLVRKLEKGGGPHKDLPIISSVIAMLVVHKPQEILALTANNVLTGLCPWTDRAWTDTSRAAEVDQGLSGYRYNLKKAYVSFSEEYARANQYYRAFSYREKSVV